MLFRSVVHYHRLRIVVRNRVGDCCRPHNRCGVVRVHVAIASVEVAVGYRPKSPTYRTPNDRGVPGATPVTRPTTVVPTVVVWMNAVVIPTVVPAVETWIVSPVVPPVVEVVVVTRSIPEGSVVVVVVPVVAEVVVIVVDVDVRIAVVPIGSIGVSPVA